MRTITSERRGSKFALKFLLQVSTAIQKFWIIDDASNIK